MSNVIDFKEYKDKKESNGGFAPITVEEQRERILLQQKEIIKQRELINIMIGKEE